MTLQRDGTVRSGPGAPGLGVLWYAARPYGDFSLKLEFRDDAPDEGARANAASRSGSRPRIRRSRAAR